MNGVQVCDELLNVNEGDVILIECLMFQVHKTSITLIGNHDEYTTNLFPIEEEVQMSDFPMYRRSPRIVKRTKEEKISIAAPPASEKMSKGGLAKVIIPPLVTGAGTVAMGIMMPRGPYIYIGLASTFVSLVFSISSFINEKKEHKKNNKRRQEVYEKYLLRTRNTLERLRIDEEESFRYHNPSIPEIENLVNAYSSRIYEKDVDHDDFLEVCVGHRNEHRTFSVSVSANELDIEKDELLDEAREIESEYKEYEQKPIHINLKKSHLGIVGDHEEIHQQLKQIMAQVTFFHSYHDVEFIFLYNETYKQEFDYVKWYPHFKISAVNVTGNIYNETVRDQVLGSLTQILKQRRDIREEKKRESSYSPHYIIIIDENHLIMNHSIMEYLQEDTTDLGFTLIYSARQRADLPENIKTVLLAEDMHTSTLLMNHGEMMNKRMKAVELEQVDLQKMARNLSVLNHQKGIRSQIPESITFFDMYHVNHPREFGIEERWMQNQSHKSLAVPLGVRAKDDIVELNLHEKAHGPHGLVAGTTGSGKSEIVQSYILSLAVNFHPHEVGFLLIDYKGGGMASLFKDLPHLLGTITNLDGSESMRALASIKSELQRRQRIFNEHNVNNIIQYNKLFKSGKASEPLPSLFIISDEFAELKKEQPEFMSELVSAARIGRSLGVKLILATQKPSGVVDDQIWSNSKFKLALKVQDENDSKEVIKTSDAAYITQAGRAYLQVGNNEIYELFQSAWSGATYKDANEEDIVYDLVYQVNDIGQAQLINKDLSTDDDINAVSKSQLDVTVDYIHEIYQQRGEVEVMKPWLPSLETQIVSPHLHEIQALEQFATLQLCCPVGIVDIPEEQLQNEFELNYLKDGNVAVFASSGFGKSFTLGTIMTTLAACNNPQLMNFYIIDLGNSALIPYVNLPHTADYMTFDSIEKITKFAKMINATIAERKKLFAKEMVQNYETYNEMFPQSPLKAIMIFLDNYDVVKELPVDLEDFILRISRDGPGLGIYITISATRSNAVRYATLNNFKTKIAQYMYDAMEINSIVGRSKYSLPEIKGRAMVKLANVNTMQVYSPVAFESNIEFTTKIKQLIEEIHQAYHGEQVMGIPVLPEVFTTNDFAQYPHESEVDIKLGLDVNDVTVCDASIQASPYLIIGPVASGKTNVMSNFITQVKDGQTVYILDSSRMELYQHAKMDGVHYATSDEQIQTFVEELISEVENRKLEFADEHQNSGIGPNEFYSTLPKYMIFIEDVDDFVSKVEKKYPKFVDTLRESTNVGIKLIATAQATKLRGYDDITKFFKGSTNGLVLVNQGNHSIFPVRSQRDYPPFGQALLFNNGDYRNTLLPKYVNKGDNINE
ncbi:S-DNA-T family DNA segregation ATPase FtsK/SpoIIIE [Breznakia blatticola]|uniref:S-DNA-T family DNA segregation ATPase FtsK/SpoIIIE n=1 Tax=Breznakia blatticola TaxID=1754012 RepID=A0A4R7ZFB7_9FIRM|nr:type VII secretion protein EssC [Breznakia blatticola]TDW08587.1 S-DNA-T family DNA segregation ATPase FtsK/SpoIIIE [Breznakia blatticola]